MFATVILVRKSPIVFANSSLCSVCVYICKGTAVNSQCLLQVNLPLRRDGTDGQAVVFWSLRAIGANHGDVTAKDLEPLSGSVVFLSGQSDASINLTVLADNIPEVNETLLLTLDRYVGI